VMNWNRAWPGTLILFCLNQSNNEYSMLFIE
jgi:hypothetical protein